MMLLDSFQFRPELQLANCFKAEQRGVARAVYTPPENWVEKLAALIDRSISDDLKVFRYFTYQDILIKLKAHLANRQQPISLIHRHYHLFEEFKGILQRTYGLLSGEIKEPNLYFNVESDVPWVALKVYEGLQECIDGFHDRLNLTWISCLVPMTLTGCLEKMRTNLVQRVACQLYPDVHEQNSVSIIAHEMGLGTPPITANPYFSGAIDPSLIRTTLKSAFEYFYTPILLIKEIETQLFNHLRHYLGYQGKKSQGFVYEEFGPWVEHLKKFFPAVETEIFLISIGEEEQQRVIDLDWYAIRGMILQGLIAEKFLNLSQTLALPSIPFDLTHTEEFAYWVLNLMTPSQLNDWFLQEETKTQWEVLSRLHQVVIENNLRQTDHALRYFVDETLKELIAKNFILVCERLEADFKFFGHVFNKPLHHLYWLIHVLLLIEERFAEVSWGFNISTGEFEMLLESLRNKTLQAPILLKLYLTVLQLKKQVIPVERLIFTLIQYSPQGLEILLKQIQKLPIEQQFNVLYSKSGTAWLSLAVSLHATQSLLCLLSFIDQWDKSLQVKLIMADLGVPGKNIFVNACNQSLLLVLPLLLQVQKLLPQHPELKKLFSIKNSWVCLDEEILEDNLPEARDLLQIMKIGRELSVHYQVYFPLQELATECFVNDYYSFEWRYLLPNLVKGDASARDSLELMLFCYQINEEQSLALPLELGEPDVVPTVCQHCPQLIPHLLDYAQTVSCSTRSIKIKQTVIEPLLLHLLHDANQVLDVLKLRKSVDLPALNDDVKLLEFATLRRLLQPVDWYHLIKDSLLPLRMIWNADVATVVLEYIFQKERALQWVDLHEAIEPTTALGAYFKGPQSFLARYSCLSRPLPSLLLTRIEQQILMLEQRQSHSLWV